MKRSLMIVVLSVSAAALAFADGGMVARDDGRLGDDGRRAADDNVSNCLANVCTIGFQHSTYNSCPSSYVRTNSGTID